MDGAGFARKLSCKLFVRLHGRTSEFGICAQIVQVLENNPKEFRVKLQPMTDDRRLKLDKSLVLPIVPKDSIRPGLNLF